MRERVSCMKVTCADIDGFAEVEDSLFPVSGCVLGAGAQVERAGHTRETNVKVPYQCLQELNNCGSGDKQGGSLAGTKYSPRHSLVLQGFHY